MVMLMDWEKEAQQQYTLVPDGEYIAKVSEWEYTKSKAKKSAKTAKAPKAPKAPKVVEADETE